MGIPTGEELLESLRDGRLPFIDGDRERMSRPIRALPQRGRGLAQLDDMRAAWARKLRPVPGWPNEYAARLRGQLGAGPDYRNQLFVLGGGFWDKLRGLFVHDARASRIARRKRKLASPIQFWLTLTLLLSTAKKIM